MATISREERKDFLHDRCFFNVRLGGKQSSTALMRTIEEEGLKRRKRDRGV